MQQFFHYFVIQACSTLCVIPILQKDFFIVNLHDILDISIWLLNVLVEWKDIYLKKIQVLF